MRWRKTRLAFYGVLSGALVSGTLLAAERPAAAQAQQASHPAAQAQAGAAPQANAPAHPATPAHNPNTHHSGTTAAFPGPNTGGRPYPIRTDIAPPTGMVPPASAYTGISPNGLRTIGPRHRPPVILPVVTSVYYGPPPAPDVEQPEAAPGPDPATAQLAASQDALAEQIRQLSASLDEMKSAAAQQQASPPEPAAAPQPEPEQPPLKLVLQSGEQLTIKSYAVVNGEVWDFSGQRVRKVPVSQVNVPASTKATEAAGGEFPDLSH